MISNMSKIVPSNAANEASIALLDTHESVTPTSVLSETKQTQRLCFACAEWSAPEDNYLFCDICLEEIKSGCTPANLRAKPPDTCTFDLYPDCCLRRKLSFALLPLIEYLHEYFAEERKLVGPERLKCSICKRMLLMPTECFPCRHTFCDPCLRQLANLQHCEEGFPENHCPVCRQVIHYTQRNVTLEREVEESAISAAERRLPEVAVAKPWPLPGYAILRRLCHEYYLRRPVLKPVHFICDYPRLTTNTFTGKSHVTAAMQGILLVHFVAIPSLIISSMCRRGSNDAYYTFPYETTDNTSVLNETEHTGTTQAGSVSCHSSELILKPLLRLLLAIPVPVIIAAVGFVTRMSCIVCTPREWRVFQAIVFALFVCYAALVPGFNALRTTTPERCPFDGVRCLVGSACWGSFAFIGTSLTIWRHRYYLRACFRKIFSRRGAAASLDRVD